MRDFSSFHTLAKSGSSRRPPPAALPIPELERRDFLDLCDDRYRLRSTVLTSQLPTENWHEAVGDQTLADSILDRMVHHAHRFELRGESLRKLRDRAEIASQQEEPEA